MEIDPRIVAYYEKGEESARLSGGFPSGPLEFARTQEIVLEHLPAGPLDILDVGGGPGAYASWLADLGHRVHVIDPVPLHIEQARAAHAEVTAEVGDARSLDRPDDSADVVLLMGPLYHLTERAERLQTLNEARRVLRTDGLMFAAAISRFAALLDILVRLDRLHEPETFEVVETAIRTGVFGGPGARRTLHDLLLPPPSRTRRRGRDGRLRGSPVGGGGGAGGVDPRLPRALGRPGAARGDPPSGSPRGRGAGDARRHRPPARRCPPRLAEDEKPDLTLL